MRTFLLTLATVGTLAAAARADEGMWTYNAFPKAAVKQKYKFDVTDAWLDHVRLSSVRFNSGGSGSFVSANGLVMTNHHVGADCIQQAGDARSATTSRTASTPRRATPRSSAPISSSTCSPTSATSPRTCSRSPSPAWTTPPSTRRRKKRCRRWRRRAPIATGARCDVVTLYHGGLYNLYTYKKYTDVRLVFAPEFQIAFFGGDPDNFEYPRYDLDVAFFRVYENGNAGRSPSTTSSGRRTARSDGELVFVSGNPGGTDRLKTVAELEFDRDFAYPFALDRLNLTRRVLEEYSAKGPEQARQAERRIFGAMNSLKVIKGRIAGLKDDTILAKKRTEEASLKKQLASDAQYAKVWDDLAALQVKWQPQFRRYAFVEASSLGSQLLGFAYDIDRLVAEKGKPNGDRLREYRDSALPSLELKLYSPAPIFDGMEEALMTANLEWMVKELGASDPFVTKVLAGKTPAARAHELIAGTKLKDPAVRKALAASKDAVAKSTDPMIVLARALDPDRRALRKMHDDTIEAVELHNHEVLARGMFAARGTSQYPDATFTLRLSYGKLAGYTVDGKKIPSMTTIAGLYARSKQADDKAPWDLPAAWADKKAKLNGKVPMDFVSTNDIIGGNSGSPVINARGEVVGLVFDGNIQSLVGDFVYDETQNRAVSVHSAALIEALRKVYDAGALADELQAPVPGKKHASR